ncbi:MAG TPA: DUF4268 domain-containing protein [Fimbriimonadales bacterium]|nr:DUF4268 domain-containing protein [Fimbriimonadales bacterium]
MEFGQIKKLNIREIWQHEAYNFTPWLAKNLDKLGEAVGMDLELVEQESSVGNFSLDILAKDLSTGHLVIIENQFGDTDFDHLGKMLTYAAGFDASKVIWISENVRDEHRQTIEWLNQRTDTDTQFFAIEIEVFKIDDSKPAYNFKPIVFPNEWRKSKKEGRKETPSARGEAYRAFFQSLIDELRTKHSFTKARIAQPQSWYAFPTGFSGITYAVAFSYGGRVRVELYLDMGETDENKKLFDWLYEQKQSIESELGESLDWERLDERRASRIAIYRDGSIDEVEKLDEIRAWAIQELLKFRNVFLPRLRTFKNR